MNAGVLILEIFAVILGVSVLVIEIAAPDYLKRGAGALTFIGLGFLLLLSYTFQPQFVEYAFGGAYVMDGFAIFAKKLFLLTAILVVLLLLTGKNNGKTVPGEYFALVLFALTGMMLSASANNLITLFVSIELVTVSFYVLTGFNKQDKQSLESGIKYLVYSAVASAFLVFGIALVYGVSGTTGFKEIAETLKEKINIAHSPLIQIGFGMILVGLGFKIAMTPFNLWVPDVYQGSPSPTTAFIATGSKAAGFILLARLFLNPGYEIASFWQEQLIALSIITILYGNLCAIPQRNIKRLIGYSSIAHAGYLIIGIATLGSDGAASILFYLFVYILAVILLFGIIAVVCDGDRNCNYDITAFSGLHKRSQFLSFAMTVALASLAGIPPLGGFFGKFLLIKSALLSASSSASYYYLVFIAIAGVGISIYYYFGIIKLIYWAEPVNREGKELKTGFPLLILIVITLIGLFYSGILPSNLVDSAKSAASSISF